MMRLPSFPSASITLAILRDSSAAERRRGIFQLSVS